MNQQGNAKATDHVGPDGESEQGVPHRSPPEYQQCVKARPTLPEDSARRPLQDPAGTDRARTPHLPSREVKASHEK